MSLFVNGEPRVENEEMRFLFVNGEFRVEYGTAVKAAQALRFYTEEFPGTNYELKASA